MAAPELDEPRTNYGRTCSDSKRRNLEALWVAGWRAIAGTANRRWWHPQHGERDWRDALAAVVARQSSRP
jgi:hypothetical protein